MTTYAIGDVQGCYDELQMLLETISFDPAQDQVWFAGDLVNRGHQSLAVLRFIRSLKKNAVVVLGNHDIHLLELAQGNPYENHTLQEVLAAPDCQELVDWLRQQPLFHYDPILNYAMVHAGILPQWNIAQTQQYAAEVETVLRAPDYGPPIKYLYGNEPDQWHANLSGWDRLRFILNVLTRIRFCTPEGKLNFTATGKVGSQPPGYFPWFEIQNRSTQKTRIVFGHWAALEGETPYPTNVFALDTGCAWGGYLTAMRLEDGQRFSVRSKMRKVIG